MRTDIHIKFFLSILFLHPGICLLAQDCECYAPTRTAAIRTMEKGSYAKALKLFVAAQNCPDKPASNDLEDKIQVCRTEIRRQEAEARQQKEGEAKAWMEIKDVVFGNGDQRGNMLSSFGDPLRVDKMRYLTVKILYDGIASESKSIRLNVKILSPDGLLKTGSSSSSGFTYSSECSIKPGKEQTLILPGWGSEAGDSFNSGLHRFELYYKGKKVYEKDFNIKKKEFYLTVGGQTSQSYSFSDDGGDKTFYVSTNAENWETWGVPSWCSVTNKTSTSFKLKCERNYSEISRTDWMKVKAGDKEVRIDIKQEAKKGPSATINNVWVNHNVSKMSTRVVFIPYVGWQQVPETVYVMQIHVDFSVYHMQNRTVNVCVFFYDSYGNKMRSSNSQYRTSDGQVSVQSRSTASYEYSHWSDYVLEIPYSVMTKGSNQFDVQIYDSSGNFMASSGNDSFTVR